MPAIVHRARSEHHYQRGSDHGWVSPERPRWCRHDKQRREPLLDQAGNSVRGQLAARHLSRTLGLSLFASKAQRSSPAAA